jgi:TetR/AcrR family transcriptional regulator
MEHSPRHKAVRNSEASRAKILDAARAEFVTHGLSGARVDRIAERAGVNKNLIYHYFQSKEELYLRILEGIYSELRERQRDLEVRDLPPVEGMRSLVAHTFDHFVETPDLIRLTRTSTTRTISSSRRSSNRSTFRSYRP